MTADPVHHWRPPFGQSTRNRETILTRDDGAWKIAPSRTAKGGYVLIQVASPGLYVELRRYPPDKQYSGPRFLSPANVNRWINDEHAIVEDGVYSTVVTLADEIIRRVETARDARQVAS